MLARNIVKVRLRIQFCSVADLWQYERLVILVNSSVKHNYSGWPKSVKPVKVRGNSEFLIRIGFALLGYM